MSLWQVEFIFISGLFLLALVVAFYGIWQIYSKARNRRRIFEAHGWKYNHSLDNKAWWKLSLSRKKILYFIEGEENGLKWRLEANKNEENGEVETLWSAPLCFKLALTVQAETLSNRFVSNPWIFGLAARWMWRREMKENGVTQGEKEKRLFDEGARLIQTLLRSRPLHLSALNHFCFSNSLWRENVAREVFDSQIENDLAVFLQKLGGEPRKTFVCRLEEKQIVLRVGDDLSAPLAIEMAQLGVRIAVRARRYENQEAVLLLNVGPIRRSLAQLPADQRAELLEQTPDDVRALLHELTFE